MYLKWPSNVVLGLPAQSRGRPKLVVLCTSSIRLYIRKWYYAQYRKCSINHAFFPINLRL